MGTIKIWPAMFSNINTKWSRWCITASLNYKNTMINRIIMETVACLRSKCHLKQNVIPSWPWSFRHTSCISDFRCKTKYTNKIFCQTPGPAYLVVLPVLVIFCPFGLTNFKKSVFVSCLSLENIYIIKCNYQRENLHIIESIYSSVIFVLKLHTKKSSTLHKSFNWLFKGNFMKR